MERTESPQVAETQDLNYAEVVMTQEEPITADEPTIRQRLEKWLYRINR